MKAGLHNHTFYSDGSYSPEEVINMASDLDYFALTDHDSVLGVLDIDSPKLIKGIELSTYVNDCSVHLLGFFKYNYIPKGIIDFSYNLIDTRKKRAIKMLNDIRVYYKCNVDFTYLGNKSYQAISRKNILDVLIKSNPNTDLKVLESYISESSPTYFPVLHLTPEDGIKLLHDNNCLVFLAHAGRIKDQQLALELLNNLDIDGIEVFYPSHDKEYESFLLDIAKKRDLLVSGGSDFHNETKGVSPSFSVLEEPYLSQFLEALNGRKD